MAEQIIPIAWPAKGLSEGWSFSAQPADSAREYQNVRFKDPVTDRLRGAQRSGMEKYLTSALKISGTKAVGLTSFFVDNRQVTYSAISSGSETTTWSNTVTSGGATRNVKTDRQGNAYALDGNSAIVKFSADGQRLWHLPLPVKDPNHLVRALWVDEFDRVYAGVSEGGVQAQAALWCYEQLPDNKTAQLWEVVTKAYVEDCRTSEGKLYTVQNRTDRKKAYVRVYDFIDETSPEQVQEWRVPHPVNSIAIKKDGAVVVACASNTQDQSIFWRDRDPLYPDSSPDSVNWTPLDLELADRRIWFWAKADEVDQTDVISDIADGVEVSRWRDSSKGLRHLFAPYDDAHDDTGPALALDAWLEHKGLRFTQPLNPTAPQNPPFQALRSQPNSSTTKTFADQQRTMLPGYTGSAWACYIVCRPSITTQTGGSTTPRWVFGQDRDNASSGSLDHILFINASSSSDNTLPPTSSSGRVFWYTGQDAAAGGDGTSGQIREGRCDIRQDASTNPDGSTTNLGQLTIIGMVCDGGTTTETSLYSINGSPIDRFTSNTQETLRATYLGIWRATQGADTNPQTGVEGFMGDILEILVLDRKDRNDATDNVLTFDNLQFDSLAASQTINEHTSIVGYLAHKYGSQANLPYGTAAVNNYPHPFGITGTGQDRLAAPPAVSNAALFSVTTSTAQALANKAWACVVKYDAKGKIVWTANEQELFGGTLRSGGYGAAVAVNSDGNIYTVGPAPLGTGSAEVAAVRMIVDQGSDFSIQTADGAWVDYLAATEIPSAHPRIDVDEFDNLYVPLSERLNVYTKTGTTLHAIVKSTTAVAVDRRIPDYRSDLASKRVEHILVEGSSFVTKIRLVSSAQAAGAVRTLYSMGVSGGDIVRFTTSSVSTPTGGSGALDASPRYVQGTSLFKKAYWTDGRQLRQYDPISNAVSEYKCLSAGAIPSRCALIESWRGRIVLARSADEPHNWFMSKKDEPTNWDYFPPVPTETDAVAGNNSSAGLCPDIINSIVPYSEDILVFGGDHSIWSLVGDPAAGGRLELVSDITGMAFGRPWCKDPNGILYFVGSRGGLFRWAPGAKPDRISIARIERQLQEIDFSAYHVKLAWNYQDEGLHIVQCPFGAGGTQVPHYFYEAIADGFAKDIFGTSAHTNVQPTDIHVLDGDDFDDRVLIFGCEDGFVRKWSRTAKSDDFRTDGSTPIPIDAFVTIFPIQTPEEVTGLEIQFHGLTVVLGDRDDGCRWELFSSDEADSFGVSRESGLLGPGRNPPIWERVVGPYCGLRLRNAAAEERFTFERAYLYASPAGIARVRTRN